MTKPTADDMWESFYLTLIGKTEEYDFDGRRSHHFSLGYAFKDSVTRPTEFCSMRVSEDMYLLFRVGDRIDMTLRKGLAR